MSRLPAMGSPLLSLRVRRSIAFAVACTIGPRLARLLRPSRPIHWRRRLEFSFRIFYVPGGRLAGLPRARHVGAHLCDGLGMLLLICCVHAFGVAIAGQSGLSAFVMDISQYLPGTRKQWRCCAHSTW